MVMNNEMVCKNCKSYIKIQTDIGKCKLPSKNRPSRKYGEVLQGDPKSCCEKFESKFN